MAAPYPINFVAFYSSDAAGALALHIYAEEGLSANLNQVVSGFEGFIDERVLQLGSGTRSMFTHRCTRGPTSVDLGMVTLGNPDGELDFLKDVGLDGQVLVARRRIAPDRLYTALSGTITGQALLSGDEVSILVRDQLYGACRATALPIKYAGNNALPAGIEGTPEDLKGRGKPSVWGIVKNITPPQVNYDKRIYQVDGQLGLRTGWTMTVYDKRVALAAGANYVSQADMEATAPGLGQYRVWPAGGCFRLGAAPAGQVTCDVTNPVPTLAFNVETPAVTGNEIHALMHALLGWWQGGFASSLGTGFVFPDFYDNWVTYPDGGLYISDDTTSVFDAVNELASSVSAHWGLGGNADALWYMETLQLREPGAYTMLYGNLAFTEDDTLAEPGLRRVISGDQDRGIPAWQVIVGYARNYTVQNATQVASPMSDLAHVQQEYRYAIAEDATVKLQWPSAPVIEVKTLLATEAAAQAEADRLLALYKVRRNFIEVTIHDSRALDFELLPLGQDTLLTYPRFGLNAGKLMRLLSITPNYRENTITLLFWG